jgi:oligopeptide/dipeptide ABC transporter ATP-binding protein
VQAQLLRLLTELQRDFGMALLLITHDLGIVGEACSRALVMYAGRCVERGEVEVLLARPAHPYTQALLRARPRLRGGRDELIPIPGRLSRLAAPAEACVFAPRCAQAVERCHRERPEWQAHANGGCACLRVGMDCENPAL